jgi:hypothetical protein
MTMRRTPALALTLGLLAGCQQMSSTTPQETAQPATVERTEMVTATVEAVDQAERLVTLRGPDGDPFTVHVADEVRNLPQVEVGDQVVIRYREAIAAELSLPGEPAAGDEVSAQVTRAPLGARPAAELAQQVRTTVRIDALDLASNTVSFTGPSGLRQTVAVQDPKMQDFLRTLTVGDQVAITYSEALAMSVEPVN